MTAAKASRPFVGLLGALCFLGASPCGAEPTVIGSKKFTESYVLAEIAKRAFENAGLAAEHRPGMGGTIILWQALKNEQITIYPEYTGTIAEEILKSPSATTAEIREQLGKFGVGMTAELGFNNTYALVMRRDTAERKAIRTIGDLRNHPELKFGLTHEFLDRQDGWRPLADKYRLQTSNLVGIDHGLGYEALRKGDIDVKDAYSTDAKIGENDLVALEDDLRFFPQYKAVYLYRLALPTQSVDVLRHLEGTIDEKRMIRLNVEAERTKNYAAAADLYFRGDDSAALVNRGEPFVHKLRRWTLRHLELAGISLLLSILVGIPLGIAASRGGAVGQVILGFTGAVQTIPSLALLALLVPLPFFGISVRTAIAALFLYGLLPIVRNTATGLQ
ncbi:MAG TPA: glycine betaine ABC transporter substrate-binding protein, partial [Chthoniobacterales bacterium]